MFKMMRKLAGTMAACALAVCGAIQAGDGVKDTGVVVNKAELSKTTVKPGDKITITFNFDAAEGPLDIKNSVFVHVRKEGGDMLNQADHQPKVATDSQGWEGKIRYDIEYTVPEKAEKGKYILSIGLYHKSGDNWVNEKMKPGEGVKQFGDGNAYIVGEFTVE